MPFKISKCRLVYKKIYRLWNEQLCWRYNWKSYKSMRVVTQVQALTHQKHFNGFVLVSRIFANNPYEKHSTTTSIYCHNRQRPSSSTAHKSSYFRRPKNNFHLSAFRNLNLNIEIRLSYVDFGPRFDDACNKMTCCQPGSSLDPKKKYISSLKLIVEAVELARAKESVVFVSSTTSPKPPLVLRHPSLPTSLSCYFTERETSSERRRSAADWWFHQRCIWPRAMNRHRD